jgi:hypothetical protein
MIWSIFHLTMVIYIYTYTYTCIYIYICLSLTICLSKIHMDNKFVDSFISLWS